MTGLEIKKHTFLIYREFSFEKGRLWQQNILAGRIVKNLAGWKGRVATTKP